jgi:hypothetical protein
MADPANALDIPRWSGVPLMARHKQPTTHPPCDTLATPPRVAPIADELTPVRSAYANGDEIATVDMPQKMNC